MSLRNIRKLYGGNELPPVEGSSDEEYEPLYAKASPSKFKYDGFVLSSHSESEHEEKDTVEAEKSSEESHTKKKKKKKQRKRKPMVHANAEKINEELDEVEKSVMEVNAILGTPPPAPIESPQKAAPDPRVVLFAVQAKHLNPSNEMRKLFGPEESETRRRGRQPNTRLLKRSVIVPITNETNFKKSGLSMSIHRRENDLTYFAFDHSREYQKTHTRFLTMLLDNYRNDNLGISIEEAQKHMHVEAMLEGADALFRFEAYSAANNLIEQIIAYMQYVAHLSFNLTNPKVRLEYKIAENRPFHIAVMKYMYLLTNRACHRTALELAKLLLNLDPSDPLAILFIVDTLALRAREHQWLIDALDYWCKEREAGFLFNVQYSNAMAHYHVAKKNKGEGMEKADELMQAAMLTFPGVVFRLLQCASVPPSARLKDCALFAKADETTGKNLRELMGLYAKLTWSKWREPGVFEWFTKNAELLAEKYDNDVATQERAKELANERLNLFQGWPEEIVRHLSVIKAMSNFLVDGAVPRVNRARAADPVPPQGGLSRYGYDRLASADAYLAALPLPQDYQRHIAEQVGRRGADILQALLGELNNAFDPREDGREGYEPFEEDDDDSGNDSSDGSPEDSPEEVIHELAAAQGAPDLVMSVESLSNALRNFMGVVEANQEPAAEPEPRDPAPRDPAAGPDRPPRPDVN